MDEVDAIIIETLKNLQCQIDENITTLRQFDPDHIVEALSRCLEAINPMNSLPHKLPPSMSQRLKIATNLVELIQSVGFKGDLGYQSVLYCNEVEIRRALMFLIERLPRDGHKTVIDEEIAYVPRLVKEIETRLKLALQKPWVPASALYFGGRDCGDVFLRQSFGDSVPVESTSLKSPKTQSNVDENVKEYWARNLLGVTEQCNTNQLIPSLLFESCRFEDDHNFGKTAIGVTSDEYINKSVDVQFTPTNVTMNANVNEETVPELIQLSETEIMVNDIQNRKVNIGVLQNDIIALEKRIQDNEFNQKSLEESVAEMENKVKTRAKTYAVLSKEENLEKLNSMIENGKERLVELAKQWNDVQGPLLEQYKNLKNNLSAEELKIQSEVSKLANIKNTNQQLQKDLKEKEILEHNLKEKCARIPKTSNRYTYTNRILEIIGNIKKQNGEIQKILKDTKVLQKEINTLNGQVERSFTLCDELIFRDAKKDEAARKAYKLLAALHNQYEEIIKDTTELGLLERECRNLQEQVDNEASKETAEKLERLLKDIEQVKKESNALLAKK